MIFGIARQIFGLLFLLTCVLQAAAQTENLSAQLLTKKTDAEIQKLSENRSEIELKEFCESLIKQGDSPELAKDFAGRARMFRLAQTTAQKIPSGCLFFSAIASPRRCADSAAL